MSTTMFPVPLLRPFHSPNSFHAPFPTATPFNSHSNDSSDVGSSTAHLAVEDIYKAPVFKQSLTQLTSHFGQSNYAFFKKIISDIADVTKERRVSACVIITRPPEIIACFSIADVPAGTELFVIFDSHPRPEKHPHGAAFIFYNSVRAAARYLAGLLHFDEDILRDVDVQWQAQLLGHCSGDVFVAAEAPPNGAKWAETALEASLQVLSLEAQVRELQEKAQSLEDDKKRIRLELVGVEHDLIQMDDLLRKEQEKNERLRRNASAARDYGKAKDASETRLNGNSQGEGSTHRNGKSERRRETRRDQMRREDEAKRSTAESTKLPEPTEPAKPVPDIDPVAVQLQIQFDEENRKLEQQMRDLQAIQPEFFDCGVCFEKFQEDHIARVEPCGHTYCRDCLKGHAVSKIDEHRYPVLCPLCTADRTRTDPPGGTCAREQYAIFEEMQMNKFSIMIHCRKCQQTLFVDKAEYQETKIIRCPLNDCGYLWCRLCSQEVDPLMPEHTCDGSNELDHLMKEKGWKYCPLCQTPAEKISGCNHIACGAPGCNSHFCYHCGALIVQSALPAEINAAKTAHYTQCTI
ncbi:uncharacterized protein TRAVEDRAFT_56732 [Trametes versicolor FP-101664 SS1]|uniref:uncharacterized protein n=1 Tax=Trametes versicolor (strain FP-101664) TaxID=717944 RepID=UPI000462196B|nr:uncharacterized protein TRAVEDRAFT_56732 [Trametes versicolor FP-101664 SS1]EIW61426.1 hypothetical protein TRAVEDRAFT_56732 [Trametes versicolor FP-101664 SS1]